MGEQIIARGGTISEDAFTKNPREFTTGGQLDGLSVFVGEVKNMRDEFGAWKVAEGYPGDTITAVTTKNAKTNYPDIKLKRDRQPNLPNHYLLSGISIENAVELFTREVTPFHR